MNSDLINKKRFALIKNKSFSIMEIWNNLISEKKLFGFESKNKFLHITNIEVYNNLLKNN